MIRSDLHGEQITLMSDRVQQCRVTEIVEKRLRESMYIPLRAVTCHFTDGQVTFRGIVPSFYLKQVIFSLVEDLEGIRGIKDEIDVVNEYD